MTLRTRLVVWLTGTITAILLIFSVAVLWLQREADLAALDAEMKNDVITVSGVLATETREIGPGKEAVEGMLDELRLPDRGIAVYDASGTLLGALWNGLDRSDARRHEERVSAAGVDYRIVVTASLSEIEHEAAILRRAVIVAIPIALVLTAIGGVIAANQANDLLARLNDVLAQQRRFMADASHELRTPVSVVRTAADVTLSKETRGEPEYRDTLRIVGEQANRLSRMVEDMFLLARADAGQRRVMPAEFYLDEVVAECVRSEQLLAGSKGVTITSEIADDQPYFGDETLARQLVTNLLDNAIRYAPRNGQVWVTLKPHGTSLQLSVSDNGAGVAPGDRERIFDRFVKLDPVRAADGGAGLGLSIARWVAEAHGGTLLLTESGAGRTTFLATLPYAHPAG